MLVQLLFFFLGLCILYVGAEGLVRGASAIAHRYGIRSIIVGVTVVALGTSMPEFVVNVVAVFTGENDLALGNVVGSNIANTGLILGGCALFAPLLFARRTLRIEYPMMMGSLVLFYLLALDGILSRVDGLILVIGLAAFMAFALRTARSGQPTKETDPAAGNPGPTARSQHRGTHGRVRRIVFVLGGIVLLAVGARIMVFAATNIAEMFGIAPIVIGLTVVAVGTSLPEIATSIVSLMRDQTDLLIGNVLGSNLMNVLFVVGMLAAVSPLPVGASAIDLHLPVMLIINALLLPIAWTGRRINRLEGAVLLAGFVAYTVYLLLPYL